MKIEISETAYVDGSGWFYIRINGACEEARKYNHTDREEILSKINSYYEAYKIRHSKEPVITIIKSEEM